MKTKKQLADGNLMGLYQEISSKINPFESEIIGIIQGNFESFLWENLWFIIGDFQNEIEIRQNMALWKSQERTPLIMPINSALSAETLKLLSENFEPVNSWMVFVSLKNTSINCTYSNKITSEVLSPNLLKTYHNFLLKELISTRANDFDKFKLLYDSQVFSTKSVVGNLELISVLSTFENENSIGIYLLITNPKFRKQGFASQLIQEVLEEGRRKKKTVILQSSANHESFFRKLGFEMTHEYLIY